MFSTIVDALIYSDQLLLATRGGKESKFVITSRGPDVSAENRLVSEVIGIFVPIRSDGDGVCYSGDPEEGTQI